MQSFVRPKSNTPECPSRLAGLLSYDRLSGFKDTPRGA